MKATAKAVQYRRKASDRHHDQAARTVLAISGALFSLVGLVLVTGGLMFALNGSAFYIFAGLGLIVSGSLVARRNPAGAWTYMLVFAATVSWSLSNVEAGSILPSRLIGPTVLLAMIAVLMPLLCRWRPRHAIVFFAVLIAATVALGMLSRPNAPLAGPTSALTHSLDAEMKGVLQ